MANGSMSLALRAGTLFASVPPPAMRTSWSGRAVAVAKTSSASVIRKCLYMAPSMQEWVCEFRDPAMLCTGSMGDIAAFIVVPIEDEDVDVEPRAYLDGAGKVLGERGALLICDEVQT